MINHDSKHAWMHVAFGMGVGCGWNGRQIESVKMDMTYPHEPFM